MNVKILLEVELDENEMAAFGPNPSKIEIGHAVADRLMLNELGRVDCRMVREVNGRLIPYGEMF